MIIAGKGVSVRREKNEFFNVLIWGYKHSMCPCAHQFSCSETIGALQKVEYMSRRRWTSSWKRSPRTQQKNPAGRQALATLPRVSDAEQSWNPVLGGTSTKTPLRLFFGIIMSYFCIIKISVVWIDFILILSAFVVICIISIAFYYDFLSKWHLSGLHLLTKS